MDRLVLRREDGPVTVLTLHNPRRRNALSRALLGQLEAELEDLARGDGGKVVVLASRGPVFSSGHDLRELAEGNVEDHHAIFALCSRVMEALRALPQPVIAQVQGLATAAGCQLVASCDLAVASEEAAFATPGVNIGLFCTTPGVALARVVHLRHALKLLLTGEPISAREALEIGLVNEVVPADRLEEETMTLARRIARASGHVLALGKRAFYAQLSLGLTEAYSLAQRVMVDNLQHPDATEGIRAFLEKRQPRWSS